METFLEENIQTVAEERLRKIVDKKRVGFTYASTVLFPETFIHQQEALGNSREEAEAIFLQAGEVEEEEERLALKREIKEAAKRQEAEARAAKRQEKADKDYGEEWVDHSDLDE